MKSKELVKKLQERLSDTHFEWQFDEKHNKLRLDHKELGKGMDISLPGILSKYETKKELAIDEVIYTIQETFSAMEKEHAEGFENIDNIFPIIRSTSFPKNQKMVMLSLLLITQQRHVFTMLLTLAILTA